MPTGHPEVRQGEQRHQLRGVLGQSPEAHLQGLFGYACEAYKLLARDAVYDPFWSLIMQDVKITGRSRPADRTRRIPPLPQDDHGILRQELRDVPGPVHLPDRTGAHPRKKAIESAHRLEFWHVIEDHYLAKGWTRRELEQYIKHLISDRYLRRGYAV